MGFDSIEGFDLTEALAECFSQDSIEEPSAVQRAAFNPILEGRHVVLQSGTGTGKTLAYLLPILQRMRGNISGRTVIFASSAELAMQIMRVASRYAGVGIAVGALAGSKQPAARVTKSTRLIAGTPSRILEMYARRKLKGVTTVVLDEPDPILAAGDAAFLREVLSRPEPKVQLVVAAATIGPNAEQLVKAIAKEDYVRAQVDGGPLHTAIVHSFVRVKRGAAKDVAMARFIEENRCKRCIVFVNEDATVRHLYRYFSEHSLRPASLNSERPKEERKKAVRDFTQSKARVLITNDAAARGLDVPDVDWVLHYELPYSAPAYVHRAGRTGRAGKSGHSVLFVSDDKRALIKRYAKELGIQFEPYR